MGWNFRDDLGSVGAISLAFLEQWSHRQASPSIFGYQKQAKEVTPDKHVVL